MLFPLPEKPLRAIKKRITADLHQALDQTETSMHSCRGELSRLQEHITQSCTRSCWSWLIVNLAVRATYECSTPRLNGIEVTSETR